MHVPSNGNRLASILDEAECSTDLTGFPERVYPNTPIEPGGSSTWAAKTSRIVRDLRVVVMVVTMVPTLIILITCAQPNISVTMLRSRLCSDQSHALCGTGSNGASRKAKRGRNEEPTRFSEAKPVANEDEVTC